MSNFFAASSLNFEEFESIDAIVNYLGKYKDTPLYFKFDGGEFERPDRYHAGVELKKIKFGEKCNFNLLLCQLILELIYANPSRKIQLIFDIRDDKNYIQGLVNYLKARSLCARVYIHIDEKIATEAVKEFCLTGDGNIFITPCVSRDIQRTYITSLSHIYPIGNLLFLS